MSLLTPVENTLKTHAFYIVVIALGLLGFHSWLSEHDARVKADAAVKQSEATVQSLENRIAAADAAAVVKVQAVVTQVKAIRTPEQAVAAIPALSDLPLNARPAVGLTTTVDAVPLSQELGQCRENEILLSACQADLTDEKAIVEQKDAQIVTLTKKPKLWKRILGTLKTFALGAAAGYLGAKI